MSKIVLDASVTLCWLFEDQATAYTDSILDRLANQDEAITSTIWPLEVANVIAVSERRKLIRPAQGAAFLDQIGQLPIRVEEISIDRAFGSILDCARRYRLSACNASYLDLAMRQSLPLSTVDSALRAAARAAGVVIS